MIRMSYVARGGPDEKPALEVRQTLRTSASGGVKQFSFESTFAKASVFVPNGFIKGLRRTRRRIFDF